MKQILKLVFLLVIGQTAFAQAPSNYTNINGRYRWIAGMFDSTFHIPKGSTPSLRTGGSTNSGGLFYNTSDSSVYTYTGTQWIKLRGSINPSDTTNKYVTQVYKKSGSDSIFYVKGGTHTWAFNDSTGSPGGGGGGKVYYFNGGVSMGTIGGFQMYELGDTANTGAAANFTRSTTGNIANFITDPNKPGLLQIPAGVWSVDAWLSETGGGANHAEIWVEVEKWDGSTITTIATSPIEQITEGATPNLYSWSVSIPTTSLTVTDRIIIQFYISNTNGKTVTLYTQNGYVGEVHTTFTTGIGAINGLTAPAQYLVTGTSGTDFNISSATATHTFNLPTASATNRGALSTTDWSTFNNKVGGSGTTNYISKFTGSSTIGNSTMQDDGTNVGIGITPSASIFNQLQVQYAVLMGNSSDATANYLGSNFYLGAGAQWKYIASNQASQLAQTSGGFNWNTAPVGTAGNNLTWTTRMQLTNAGLLGVGTSFIDSNLTVGLGTHLKRGVRMSGLPTGVGTKAVRINANGTLSVADTLANGVSGTGTTNYIPKFTSSSAIGNSIIYDNGGEILIGTTTDYGNYKLQVNGNILGVSGNIDGNDNIALTAINYGTNGTTFSLNSKGTSGIMTFLTANTERMRLDASGNLGIGTSAPSFALDVATATARIRVAPSTTTNYALFQATNAGNTAYLGLDNSTGGLSGTAYALNVYHNGAYPIVFSTSGINRMWLDASGNLGLGTSAPTAKLDVSGTARFTGNVTSNVQFISNNGTVETRLSYSSTPAGVVGTISNHPLEFYTNSSAKMTLSTSGNLGLGVTPSAWDRPAYQSTQNLSLLGLSNTSNLAQNAYYNAGWKYITTAAAADFQVAQGAFYWFNAPSGTAGSAISFTQAMTLDASGRLGIGTTSPTTTLDVNGKIRATDDVILAQTNPRIDFDGGATGALRFLSTSTGNIRMVIQSGGNVGIGTTSPTAKLHINDGTNTNLRMYGSSGVFVVSAENDAGSAQIPLSFNNAMRITSAGLVGIGYTAPTEALAINGNLAVGSTASSGYKLFVNGSAYIAGSTNYIDGLTIFRTAAAAEMARFTSSGELLINTTSDAGDYKLQVNGNTYGNGTAYFTGNMGIGVAPATDVLLYSTKALSGSVAPTGIFLGGLVSATSTTAAAYYITNATTENATFTLPHLYHYRAVQGTFGASSTVTNQYGFSVANSLTSATNNFAFYGDLAAATGRWNLYMNGTANNYLAGETLIATTSDAGDYKLQVAGAGLFEVTDAGVGTKTIVATFGRTGATASGTSREAGIVFRDNAGTTLTGGITGVRDNSGGNYLGGLKFYVNSTSGTPSSTFANLTTAMTLTSSGNTELGGSIKTAAPSGGTAKPWKLGEAGVSVGGANTTAVKVEIDGVVYYLLTAYLPEPAPESAPKPKPEG